MEGVGMVEDWLEYEGVTAEALAGVPYRRYREIIRYRFALNGYPRLRLRELGVMYGVTANRIRQIEVKALRQMRYYQRTGKVAPSQRGWEDD